MLCARSGIAGLRTHQRNHLSIGRNERILPDPNRLTTHRSIKRWPDNHRLQTLDFSSDLHAVNLEERSGDGTFILDALAGPTRSSSYSSPMSAASSHNSGLIAPST